MKVLITLHDVEPAVRLNAKLESEGIETVVVSPLDDIRAEIKRARPDLIFITGDLTDPANIGLLREQLWAGTPVAGLDGDDPEQQERFRALGFVDLFPKPINVDDVADSLRRLMERHALQEATGLIGESEPLREVMVKVEQMAPVSSTVLIEGESGTGKELVARALRARSPRRNKPFIAVNVGALPETLLESELFGHEKGAFTGAAERRLGRFELADGGTIFLDEIGNVPLRQQAKLLRVIESGELERVGSSRAKRVDVRVISATNTDLQSACNAGQFREDLLFRLNTVEIQLPALRERSEDIPVLATHFLSQYATRYRRQVHGIDPAALRALLQYAWPGNVRELEHTMERAVLMCRTEQIQAGDLGLGGQRTQAQNLEELSLETVESILIRKALQRFQGNVSQAAEALGLSRGALYRRMEKYGL